MKTNLPRQSGFDDLRVAVIALVVLVHSNVTYSGLGSWYYVENPSESLDTVSLVVFGLVGTFLQAWFMGTLFFVGGLFSVSSLERKGRGAFVVDRAARLLGPFFAFVLVVNPLMVAAFRPEWLRWSFDAVLSGSGPLWFTAALFVFSAVWACFPRGGQGASGGKARSVGLWCGVTLVAGLGAWAVRTVLPIGTSWYNFQLCFFPAYLVLFASGTWLGGAGRFQALPASWARLTWLTPLVSLPLVAVLLISSGAVTGDRQFAGGTNGIALAYALWEAATAVGMTLGLAVWARDRNRNQEAARAPRWRGLLRDHGFAVYFLHTPVLWGLSLALGSLTLYPLLKAPLVAALCFGLTLVLAVFVRRIPGVSRLLA